MFKPIMSQDELDTVISDRLKRERAKQYKRHSEELQGVIQTLTELQDRWETMAIELKQGDRT